jgi:ribosomal protein S27AE
VIRVETQVIGHDSVECSNQGPRRRPSPSRGMADYKGVDVTQATRVCQGCGANISDRRWNARSCITCNQAKARARARQAKRNPGQLVRIERRCLVCATLFVAKRVDSLCCSRPCTQRRGNQKYWQLNHPQHTPRCCRYCGVQFQPSRSDSFFCSPTCSRKSRPSGYVPVVRQNKVCPRCGKSFIATRSDALYCTGRCVRLAHYDRNRTERIRRATEWNRVNTERRRVIARAYKDCRRAWIASGSVAVRDWLRLLNRYGGCCAYCGSAENIHMEHVVPLSRGGRHTIGNVLPACRDCNLSKHNKLLMEWRIRKVASNG